MSGSLFGRRARAHVLRVGLASVLAGGYFALGVETAAAAEPAEPAAVRMQDFAPEDFTQRAASLPDDLVRAVRRDLGVAAPEYLAAAATARQATDVVAALGAPVRSAWLDGGDLHVAVDDESAAPAVRSVGATVHVGDGLTDALAAARAQDKLAYVDRDAGEVMPVDVALHGEPVGQAGLLAQSDDTWHGGAGFAISDLLMDYRCSTGFTGTSVDGEPRVLTAGHCGSTDDGLLSSPVHALDTPSAVSATPDLQDSWPEHIGDEVGELDEESFAFGDGKDAGLIDITASGWDVAPEVTAPDTGPTPPAKSSAASSLTVLDAVAPITGAPVCSAGATSGWTCGHILSTATTAPVSGEDVTGFLTDACVLPGDSGGAVTIGPYAVGINSGSTWTSTSCSDGAVSPAAGGSDVSLVYPITGGPSSVDAQFGDAWDLLIHVGSPTITAPSEDSTVGATPTVSGTIDAAAGATVKVSIDGDTPIETVVSPAGRWEVSVDDALAPGTHSYEVAASHVAATATEPTAGDTVTGSFEVATVASLNATWPQPGDTTTTHRPTFTGTGQPDATVELSVGDDVRATTTVDHDGSWALKPADGLDAGRFDAVLTQRTQGAATSVTVPEVGLAPGSPVITNPRSGETIGPDHAISGVGGARAVVSVRISDGDEPARSAADDVTARVRADAEGAWKVQLEEPLPAGAQTIIATQSVDDLTSEPSAAVSVAVGDPDVAARAGGQLSSDEADLAETGSATMALAWLATSCVLAGVALSATARSRRTR